MMVKKLHDSTPYDLHLEISSLDCTQDRAHEIKRYAYKCYEEFEGLDFNKAEEWYTLISEVEDLWGDYVHFYTNDKF